MKHRISIDGSDQYLGSLSDVEHFVIDLHLKSRGYPRLIQAIAPNGATMSIGVGRAESVLNYIAPDQHPAYTAIGSNPSSQETIAFSICGEETQLSRRYAMAFEKALNGFTFFCESGNMSSEFQWEQD